MTQPSTFILCAKRKEESQKLQWRSFSLHTIIPMRKKRIFLAHHCILLLTLICIKLNIKMWPPFSHISFHPSMPWQTIRNNIRIARKVYVWLLTVFCANYWQPCGRVPGWRAWSTSVATTGHGGVQLPSWCRRSECVKVLAVLTAKLFVCPRQRQLLAITFAAVSPVVRLIALKWAPHLSPWGQGGRFEFRLDYSRVQINSLSMVCSSFNLKSASCGVNCRVSVSVHLLLEMHNL